MRADVRIRRMVSDNGGGEVNFAYTRLGVGLDFDFAIHLLSCSSGRIEVYFYYG